jgi:hypothetical protein
MSRGIRPFYVLAIGVAAASLLAAPAMAQKGKKPDGGGGGGGGDAAPPSGVVYYHFNAELISMGADGSNKTALGLPIGDAIPSMARHDGTRWFLHGYADLSVTNEANQTITLYSAPEGAEISQMRWISDPVAGVDAAVSWWEYHYPDDTHGVLVRAPVVYGANGEMTGLDLAAAEAFSGLYWDYDWSPDGTAVAYRNGSALWIYDIVTDVHTPLPTSINSQPRWSPDGTRIAYGASGENWTSIETIHLSDLSITEVARARNHGVNGKYVNRPIWSPDGQYIVYVHLNASGFDWYQDIIRRTRDGKSPTNLTADVTLSFIPWLNVLGWTLE